ncbi:MAG: molybdopterin-binding protein [Candidatus Bathyarchaeota archaeon]|nr:molybdopterin-binding protein [Candidatus Bathyarchaeota archaeon]
MTEKLNRNTRKKNFAVIVCNSIIYEKFRKNQQFSDPLTDLIVKLVTSAGHDIVSTQFLPDDRVMLGKQVGNIISSKSVDAIIVCGGTGLKISEITLECLRPLMVKTIPGFAEIFRKLSYEKFGSKAITLRALAGITDHQKVLFCIPESLDSVKMVLTQLVLPEIETILEKVQKS